MLKKYSSASKKDSSRKTKRDTPFAHPQECRRREKRHGAPGSSAAVRQDRVLGTASGGRSSHLPILVTLAEASQ